MFVKAMDGIVKQMLHQQLHNRSDAWVVKSCYRRGVEAAEMRCPRAMCGITKYGRMRNKRIRRHYMG